MSDNASQGPVQMNPQTGQLDYSAQWVEYYRTLGMHREADMIEQQAKQAKPEHTQQPGKLLTAFRWQVEFHCLRSSGKGKQM